MILVVRSQYRPVCTGTGLGRDFFTMGVGGLFGKDVRKVVVFRNLGPLSQRFSVLAGKTLIKAFLESGRFFFLLFPENAEPCYRADVV